MFFCVFDLLLFCLPYRGGIRNGLDGLLIHPVVLLVLVCTQPLSCHSCLSEIPPHSKLAPHSHTHTHTRTDTHTHTHPRGKDEMMKRCEKSRYGNGPSSHPYPTDPYRSDQGNCVHCVHVVLVVLVVSVDRVLTVHEFAKYLSKTGGPLR